MLRPPTGGSRNFPPILLPTFVESHTMSKSRPGGFGSRPSPDPAPRKTPGPARPGPEAASSAPSARPNKGRSVKRERASGGALWLTRIFWSLLGLAALAAVSVLLIVGPNRTPLVVCEVYYSETDSDLLLPDTTAPSLTAQQALKDVTTLELFPGRQSIDSIQDLLQLKKHENGSAPWGRLGRDYLIPYGTGGQEAVLYVSCRVAVNSAGEPCLIDRSSSLLDEQLWSPLHELLEAIDDEVDKAKKVPPRRVVVVLDPQPTPYDPRWGNLDFAFSEAVSEHWKSAEYRNLWLVLPRVDLQTADWLLLPGISDRRRVIAETLAASASEIGLSTILADALDQRMGAGRCLRLIPASPHADVAPVIAASKRTVESDSNDETPAGRSSAEADQVIEELETAYKSATKSSPWRLSPRRWAWLQWRLLDIERDWLAGSTGRAVQAAKTLRSELANVRRTADTEVPVSLSAPADQLQKLFELMPSLDEAGSPAAEAHAGLRKDILELRRRTDSLQQLAIPEIRAVGLLRSRLRSLNADRRNLEDLAFLGNPSNWDAIASDLPNLREKYERLVADAVRWAEIFEMRDRLFAELPWLIEWTVHEPNLERAQTLELCWNDLLDASRRLESSLNNPAETGVEDLHGNFANVDQRTRTILEAYQNASREFERSDPANLDPHLRQVFALLQTPLTVGDGRWLLLKHLRSRLPVKLDGGDTSVDRESRLRFLTLLRGAPFAAGAAAAETDATSLAQLGKSLRDRSQSGLWSLKATDWAEQTSQLENSRQSALVDQEGLKLHRQLLFSLDWRYRSVAVAAAAGDSLAGYYKEPLTDSDEVFSRLEIVEVAANQLEQARETLRDFYGPASDRQSSYFVAAAEGWLQPVEAVPEFKPLVDSLRQQTKRLADLSGQLLHVNVTPEETQIAMPGPVELPPIQIAVKPPGASANDGIPVDLRPTGSGALWVDDGQGNFQRLKDAARQAVGIGDASTPQFSLDIAPKSLLPGSDDETKRFRTELFFRGHRARPAPFSVSHVTYRPTDRRMTLPPLPPEASVEVRGSVKKPLWVMVVLDCSRSMAAPVGGDKELAKSRRFDVARATLLNTLSALVTETRESELEVRVGLIAYGHRIGISSSQPVVRVFANPQNPSADPVPLPPDAIPPALQSLHVVEDVEVLKPLLGSRPWDQAEYERIKDSVNALSCVGFTPLYLALDTAMTELNKIDSPQHDAEKVILAITDGVNTLQYDTDSNEDVTARISLGFPRERPKFVSYSQLGERLKKMQHLNVRIIGFQLDDQERAKPEFENLEGLADDQQNHLTFSTAASPDALAQQLKNLVKPVTYVIRLDDAPGSMIGPFRLGTRNPLQEEMLGRWLTVRVDGVNDANPPHTQRFQLSGGEAVRIHLNAPANRLEFHPFPDRTLTSEQGVVVYQTLETADRVVSCLAFPDVLDRAERRFRVAIQPRLDDARNSFSRFPDRPKWAAARITPLDRDQKAVPELPPYVFLPGEYGFESDRPVPVLSFRISDWPPGAVAARLEVWFGMSDFPPARSRTLSSVGKPQDFGKLGQLTLTGWDPSGRALKVTALSSPSKSNAASGNSPQPIWWIRGSKGGRLVDPKSLQRKFYPQLGRMECELEFDQGELDPSAQVVHLEEVATEAELSGGRGDFTIMIREGGK